MHVFFTAGFARVVVFFTAVRLVMVAFALGFVAAFLGGIVCKVCKERIPGGGDDRRHLNVVSDQ